MSARDYFFGKKVIVTGGSSGIGLSFAKKIVAWGADVTLVARRADVLADAKREVEAVASRGTVRTLSLDVAREEDVARTIPGHIEAHGVDMLVNNAGVVMPGRFLELPNQQFRQMMDVNYFGAVYM